MKSLGALRVLMTCLDKEDVAVFAGTELCVEASKYDREGNLYLNDLDSPMSVVIGIANAVEKRVVFFCEDELLMKDLGSAAQAAASKCVNLFYVVLISGQHRLNNTPTLTVTSIKGILFSMGYMVHNYTPHFEFKGAAQEIRNIWAYVKGPLAAFVHVTPRKYKAGDFESPAKTDIKRLTTFLNTE